MLALHYAAWQGMSDPVHTLLQWKSPVNEVSQDGNTPLHLACQHGHFDVVSREGGRGRERQTDTDKQTDKQTRKNREGGGMDSQTDFFYFKWCVIRESVSFMYKMIDYKYFALLSQLLNFVCTVRKVRSNNKRKGIQNCIHAEDERC